MTAPVSLAETARLLEGRDLDRRAEQLEARRRELADEALLIVTTHPACAALPCLRSVLTTDAALEREGNAIAEAYEHLTTDAQLSTRRAA